MFENQTLGDEKSFRERVAEMFGKMEKRIDFYQRCVKHFADYKNFRAENKYKRDLDSAQRGFARIKQYHKNLIQNNDNRK